MKKLFYILLAAAAAFSLTGCGGGDTNGGDKEEGVPNDYTDSRLVSDIFISHSNTEGKWSESMHFEYDDQDRLVSIVMKTPNDENELVVSYEGNEVKMGIGEETDSYYVRYEAMLNGDGNAVSGKITEFERRVGIVTLVTDWGTAYSAGRISDITYDVAGVDANETTVYMCDWADGNLTGVRTKSGVSGGQLTESPYSTTAEYSKVHYNKANLDLNFLLYKDPYLRSLDQTYLALTGHWGERSEWMVLKTATTMEEDESEYKFYYKADSDGYIVRCGISGRYGYTAEYTLVYTDPE